MIISFSHLLLHGSIILLTVSVVEDPSLTVTIFEDLPDGCDPFADFDADVDGLGGDVSAFAECFGDGRKRSTGRLRLAIVLSRKPSAACLKSSACRRYQALILSYQARAVISRAKAGRIKVNVTDTRTAEVTQVQLSGKLKPTSNTVQRTCAPGTVLDVYSCGEFIRSSYKFVQISE